MQTIIGLYNDLTTANLLVQELEAYGTSRDHITLVSKKAANSDELSDVVTDSEMSMSEGASLGALTGGTLGLLASSLAALAVPGVGPVLAAAPLIGTLAGVVTGGVTGGVIVNAMDYSLSEEEMAFYRQKIALGATLVAVTDSEEAIERTKVIMSRYQPIDAYPDMASETDSFSDYQPDFRTHYDRFDPSGRFSYDDYYPAYRYGYSLATDSRSRDHEWSEIEWEVRREWEKKNEGTWERFKGAIQYAFQRVKAAV